jgi:hypothetical protein
MQKLLKGQFKMKSPTLGTRLIKKYGDEAHRAEVRHNKEYDEFQVHHYENGKHMGEGPVSYHGDDKEDAHDTAKASYEQRAKKRDKEKSPQRTVVTSENRNEFMAKKLKLANKQEPVYKKEATDK